MDLQLILKLTNLFKEFNDCYRKFQNFERFLRKKKYFIFDHKIGGMGREKKQNNIRSNHKSEQTKKEPRKISQPLAPQTQPQQGKRRLGDLKAFLKKQSSISPPTIQQKFPLQNFLKNSTIQSLVLQSSNLQLAIQKIKKKISIDRNILYSTLQKYFRGNINLRWSDKYFPRNLKQSLHTDVGQKVKIWLKSFNHYRNTSFQDSNSFIDDYLMQVPNPQLKAVRQFGWKLKGLIIKGRSGVGKVTLIKSVAKEVEYDLYLCGNDYNQIKYLKQKNEATQSQSVRTKINKNQNIIKKTNQSITTFAKQKEESEVQIQSEKIQLMHDVNNFFPVEDQVKFQNQLKKTIQSSKIPFIMTISSDKIPQNFKIYDVIEFNQAKTEDIAIFLFLIYHIQKWFNCCIRHQKIIEKDKYKSYLNESLENFVVNIDTQLKDFQRLTQIFNGKLDILFTYVENSFKYFNGLNLENAQLIMKKLLKQSTDVKLMMDFFYNSEYIQTEQSNVKTDKVIEPIDMSEYLLKTQQQKQNQICDVNGQKSNQISRDLQEPTQMFTPQKENQERLDQFSKTKTLVKDLSIDSERQVQQSLLELIKQIDLKVIEDFKPVQEQQECYEFSKCNSSRQNIQQRLIHNISIDCHRKIRQKIVNNVKKQFYGQNQLYTSLKVNQLTYVGFLIDSRSRLSRKNKNKEGLNLKKLLRNNQINYLKTFTQIIKPGILQ